jgi:hypothetical protein
LVHSACSYKPVISVRSSISVTGSSSQVTCPEFTTTVAARTNYQEQAEAQRVRQLTSTLATVRNTRNSMLSALLKWSGQHTLPSGAARTDSWSGQVYDIFDNSGALTSVEGNRVSIKAPTALTTVPSGQQATCSFMFGTLTFSIPYTLSVSLLYDSTGSSSYSAKVQGVYQVESHTEMVTTINLSGIGPSGMRAGGFNLAGLFCCCAHSTCH